MMTDRADGRGGAAASVRISIDNASDASDDDSRNLDTRKRKELSFAAPDAVDSLDQNKRTKHESSEYSGASFDPHQGATSAEEAPELYTSFDSQCDTSSGEEGFDPFTQHKPGAFKQVQRDDSWSGERNLLQLQLGSFIRKEKLKLESESESESLHSRSSIESAPDDRFSGSSLLGYLRESRSFAECSENTGYYSSRTTSLLSSVMRNKEEDEVRVTDAEERVSLTRIVHGVSWPSPQVHKSTSVHQKFVLSSGRPSNVTAAREDTRVYTIDRDFDDYFAKLML